MKNKKEETASTLEEEVISDLHLKGKQYIDHFSSIKMRYKKLAFTYAAAYLVGLAYISLYEEQAFQINKFNLIAFATILIITGIKLIQFLDINIGHEQLRNIFKYLLIYEKKPISIIRPYLKIEQLLYDKNFDPVIIDFLFYLSLNFGIAILGILALILKLRSEFLLSMGISIALIAVFSAGKLAPSFY